MILALKHNCMNEEPEIDCTERKLEQLNNWKSLALEDWDCAVEEKTNTGISAQTTLNLASRALATRRVETCNTGKINS